MNKNAKKGMTVLVMLGFFASVLAVMAPVGATGGRQPVFAVTAAFLQAGQTTTFYDVNSGGNLTINLAVTNSGDNTTTATVVLGFHDDNPYGFLDGPWKTWSPQTLNNDTPTELSFTMEPFLMDYLFIYPFYNPQFWVAINDTSGTPINQSFPIGSKVVIAAVNEVTAMSSNAVNSSMLVLGIDTLNINVNVTAFAYGKDLTAGKLDFYLDDTSGTSIGNVSLTTMTNNTNKQYTFSTNLSGITPAPSFDIHKIIVESVVGTMTSTNESKEFAIVQPMANVMMTNLTVDLAAALEGSNVTFTATLNNTGTAGAVNQTVEFWDGTTFLGNVTNISVGVGELKPVTFAWTLPSVAQDLSKTITSKVGTQAMTVNLTVKHKFPQMQVGSFTVPDGKRIADITTFTATVKNNGTGDATNATVSFLDGTTILATSAPFTLTVGSSTQIALNVTISGTGDVNHTFFVKVTVPGVADVTQNVSKLVGHTLAPASVGISTFTVKTKTFDKEPKDSSQSNTLTIVLKNSGEIASSNCTLKIMEGKKVLATESIVLAGNTTVPKTYTWKVSGSGDHTAIATLSGADTGTPATMSVKCTLNYTPGFEVLFLVAAIGIAAILVRRRKN